MQEEMPTLPAVVDASPGIAPQRPGHGLTPEQREAAAIKVGESISNVELAARLHVCERTIYNWLHLPAFREFLTYLTDEATAETVRAIRALHAVNWAENFHEFVA